MPAERTAMRHVREVLRLKFVGGVPTREIARRVGVAASTVRATIKRFQAAGLSWPPPEELITASTRGYFPMPARSRATDVRSSPTGPASQIQSGHSSESEINQLVMAITSAEATFWPTVSDKMVRLPHVAGELIAHVK